MNLILRLLRVILAALRKPRLGLLDESTLEFRVVPTDLDINMHMTNARYLSFMDLGRTDLVIRVGMLDQVRRNRWRPVVGGIDIKFRRSLRPFQRFRLHTRLLCWDSKWFYMEQRIESARGVHTVATVKGLFVGPRGSVPSSRVLESMGYGEESPAFPTNVLCLVAWEEAGRRQPSARRDPVRAV